MKRKGLALILVVGVLGVLAVLGSAFAVLSRLERKAAAQRIHSTRAWLLARSGIEDAAARLAAGQDPDASENAYGGENWDASSDLKLSAFEWGQQVYNRTGGGTCADIENCPVQHAMRPSYPVMAGPNPRLLWVDRRQRGYSGRLGGEKQTYSLRALTQGGIYLNGGDPSRPPVAGEYNSTLRRMLGYLAEAFDQRDGSNDGYLNMTTPGTGIQVDRPDGYNLIDKRPLTPKGWESWDQVRDLALGGRQKTLDLLKPCLTLNAWVDKKVIQPNPGTLAAGFTGTWADLKKAHRAPTTLLPAPDFERSPLAANAPIMGRAPACFSFARRRRPLLLALLGGLQGYCLKGTVTQATIVFPANLNFDPPIVLLAKRIEASTDEVGTWPQWSTFCDNLTLSSDQKVLLKANFCPESDLNLFNPGPALWKEMDKSDQTVYSTEFSLDPVLFAHEISSCGRVIGADGRLLASRILTATLPGASQVRLTTQRELVCQDLGRLEVAGDESGVRLPGDPLFLNLSRGTGKTWGHTLPGMGQGLALQSYPEPCANPGTGLRMGPADYDGHLELATVETPPDGLYGVTADTALPLCLGRYDDSLDLDVFHDPLNGQNLTDTSQVTTAELVNSLMDTPKPNTLYPDGFFLEKGCAPAYRSRLNLCGFHGLISLWVRRTSRGGLIFDARNYGPDPSHHQFFGLGTVLVGSVPGFGAAFEDNHDDWDFDHEQQFQAPLPGPPSAGTLAPGVWSLATFFWDYENPDPDSRGEFVVNGGRLPQEIGSNNVYSGTFQGPLEDFTLDDAQGPHRMVFGGGRTNSPIPLSASVPAAATLDEVAIYDFGMYEGSAALLASARYAEGRYYKGSVYTRLSDPPANDQAADYFSPVFRLPLGSLLEKVSWTWHRPAALPDDYAELELVETDGSAYLGETAPSGSRFTRSTLDPGWGVDRPAWDLGRILPGPFRMHAVFRRKAGSTTVDMNTPILESPALDEITLRYRPMEVPSFLEWKEGS